MRLDVEKSSGSSVVAVLDVLKGDWRCWLAYAFYWLSSCLMTWSPI